MQKQDRLGQGASARDLVRSIEEMVSDGLIEAHQQGASCVRLEKDGDRIVTRIADLRAPARTLRATAKVPADDTLP
jgi:hypothetical protein